DLEVGHVLTGGVVGCRPGNQTALAIDDIGSQAAAIDFLQPPNQELHVFDGADHAQKTSSVHNRSAHQHHGTCRLPAAYDEGLAVVRPAFAGCVMGALR